MKMFFQSGLISAFSYTSFSAPFGRKFLENSNKKFHKIHSNQTYPNQPQMWYSEKFGFVWLETKT